MAKTSRTMLLATVMLLFCVRAEPTPAPRSIDEPPEKTVEQLATAPHGIAMLSDDNKVRIDMIKRDPAPYLTVIGGKYRAGTIASLASEPASEIPGSTSAAGSFITTAMVLRQVDDPRASELVEAWWLELDAARSADAPANVTPMLERMQRATLSALGARPRHRVTSRILGELEQMERGKRVSALGYLIRSNQGNAEAVRRLRTLHETPGSRLHHDQGLAKAISALSGERRAPGAEPGNR